MNTSLYLQKWKEIEKIRSDRKLKREAKMKEIPITDDRRDLSLLFHQRAA
jgi:hypothetical protein